MQRIALHGWDSEPTDRQDRDEQALTRYVLKGGLLLLTIACLRVLITSPLRFCAAVALATRMGWHADRPMPYHFIYVAEACRILYWLREFGSTHIHAHFGTNSAEVAMLVHVLNGSPYSFTAHGTETFDKPEFLGLKEKIHRSAFVVAVNSFGRAQLYRWIDHADWPKVQVVHCGLEQDFYAVEAALPLPGASARLICVGRLCEEKGQLLLVEAIGQLARKGVVCELVLAGDGALRVELERSISRLGLNNQIRITGWISSERVREEILAARGLVLPSFAEGLPVVIMEAMALRRPVLSTYVGGIPELVQPGVTGWLFPAGDIEALSAAIEQCLSRTPAELKSMGEAAYKRAIARHSIDVAATKLARLFAEGEK